MSKKKEAKTKGFVERTLKELNEQLVLFKKELFNLRFQKKLGELKNTGRFSVVRKEVARIKTELVKRLNLGDK